MATYDDLSKLPPRYAVLDNNEVIWLEEAAWEEAIAPANAKTGYKVYADDFGVYVTDELGAYGFYSADLCKQPEKAVICCDAIIGMAVAAEE